jgi:hypothetical protein
MPLTLPDGQPMAMSLRTAFGQPMEGGWWKAT